jgi:hypothetical protein
MWRRLESRDVDHEALWLAVGGAALCILSVALVTPGIQLPLCTFKTITGLPCPTCGVTRTIIALSRGQLSRALYMNPLIAVACGLALLYLLYCATVFAFRLPRFRPTVTAAGARRLRIAGLAVLLVNWAWLIATGR